MTQEKIYSIKYYICDQADKSKALVMSGEIGTVKGILQAIKQEFERIDKPE